MLTCACGKRQRPVRITEEALAPGAETVELAARMVQCERCGTTLVDWHTIHAMAGAEA